MHASHSVVIDNWCCFISSNFQTTYLIDDTRGSVQPCPRSVQASPVIRNSSRESTDRNTVCWMSHESPQQTSRSPCPHVDRSLRFDCVKAGPNQCSGSCADAREQCPSDPNSQPRCKCNVMSTPTMPLTKTLGFCPRWHSDHTPKQSTEPAKPAQPRLFHPIPSGSHQPTQ